MIKISKDQEVFLYMLVKVMLEYCRVLFLLIIYSLVVSLLYYNVVKVFDITTFLFVDIVVYILSVSLFYVWYRKRDQYKGWL